MDSCPAIDLTAKLNVSGILSAMDCRVKASVHGGFDRLFGTDGIFGHVLTAMLVIYVAVMAYGLLTGRMGLTIRMMSPKIVVLVLVITFVSAWPAYSNVFYKLLMEGPDEIAAALQNQRGSATMAFAAKLDGLIKRFSDIAMVLDAGTSGRGDSPLAILGPKPMPITLFWLSGLILILSTVGALIVARLCLYILLVLGPVFILLALFPKTRGLFNGWLRTSLAMALVPMLIVLGGTTTLSLIMPVLAQIEFEPMMAVQDVKPMVILFTVSALYAALLVILVWVAASLVHDWRPTGPGSDPSFEKRPPALQPVRPYAPRPEAMTPMGHRNMNSHDLSVESDATMMTIVHQLSSDPNSATPISTMHPRISGAATDRQRGGPGLGQRFRPFAFQPSLGKPGK